MPSPRHRLLPLVATVLVPSLATFVLAGCGDDAPGDRKPDAVAKSGAPSAPTTVVDREKPSADPAIAALQEKIAAWKQSTPPRLDLSKKDWRSTLPLRPLPDPARFDAKKTYFWTLKTTQGTIRIRLLTEKAPKHAANIVYLSLIGFYDGLTFHKALPGKVLEGGCPIGDGLGTPGYTFQEEFGTGEQNAHNKRGLVTSTAMGSSTDDCKFRILLAPDPSQEKFATVFGEVADGADVVSKIEALGDEKGYPKTRVEIQRAELEIR